MDNTKLIATHKRLTLLFTGMVFSVVFIFGFSALTARYYNEQRIQKGEFEISTQAVLQGFYKGENMFPNISGRQQQRLQDAFRRLTEGNLPGPLVSYFVLDEDNRIVLDNIVEKPDFNRIILDKDDIFYTDEETMIRVSSLGDSLLGEKIIFYKKQQYSWEDFVYDVSGFLLLSLFLALALYFLGYRFVGKALRPVEQSLEDMSDFIHNAGHELKTPLAVMRGNLQVMQSEKDFDPSLIKKSISQVDHINNLIEGLRELAELGQISEKENLALAPEISKIVKEYEVLIESKNLHITNTAKGAFILRTNRNELRVLLANIISNAVKYTPEGGNIDISFTKNTLSIKDSGAGISQTEQEKIFTRFYQGSEARSKEGFGIGLSLVKKIADMNGWKITIESEEGKGSNFKVTF